MEHVVTEKRVEFFLRFGKAFAIHSVHEVHDTVHCREVVLPQLARGLMTAKVVRLEANIANHELLTVGMECRRVGLDLVILQHHQQRRLARVVQAEKENSNPKTVSQSFSFGEG